MTRAHAVHSRDHAFLILWPLLPPGDRLLPGPSLLTQTSHRIHTCSKPRMSSCPDPQLPRPAMTDPPPSKTPGWSELGRGTLLPTAHPEDHSL